MGEDAQKITRIVRIDSEVVARKIAEHFQMLLDAYEKDHGKFTVKIGLITNLIQIMQAEDLGEAPKQAEE